MFRPVLPVAFTPGGDPFVISMVDEVQGVYFGMNHSSLKNRERKRMLTLLHRPSASF